MVAASSATLFVVASTILYSRAQPPSTAPVLGFVCLVPWIVALHGRSVRAGVLSGFAVGTFGGMLIASWLLGALRAFGATGWAPWGGFLAATLLVQGIPFAFLGAVLTVTTRLSPLAACVLGAAAFYSMDTLRSDSGLGVPWGVLGLSQFGSSGVAQLAVLGGLPAVSALLAAANVAVATRLCARSHRHADVSNRVLVWVAGATAGLALAGHPAATLVEAGSGVADAPLRALVVQPNLGLHARMDRVAQRSNLGQVFELTERELHRVQSTPDLLLWPESVLSVPLDTEPGLAADLEAFVDRLGIPLVLGVARSSTRGPGYYRNSVVWIEPGRGIISAFDKTRAVPVVEGESPIADGILRLLLGGSVTERRVELGSNEGPLRSSYSLIPAACYEIAFPELIENRRTDDVRAIVNVASDSWVQGDAVSQQQLAFASFRAIEQGLPVLRAAEGGVSAVIGPDGSILASQPAGTSGALEVLLPPRVERTWVRLARVAAAALLGGCLALAGYIAFRRFYPMRLTTIGLILVLVLGSTPALADEVIGTLTLDGLSVLSLQDQLAIPLPTGSTIRFHFGDPASDGSRPVRIVPTDLSLPAIQVPGGGEAHYALSEPAAGTMREVNGTVSMEFSTTLRVSQGAGATTYRIRFTTETATAESLDRSGNVEVQGMRIPSGARHIQLVGATTNHADAELAPGTAVYAVLSGVFDQLPSVGARK